MQDTLFLLEWKASYRSAVMLRRQVKKFGLNLKLDQERVTALYCDYKTAPSSWDLLQTSWDSRVDLRTTELLDQTTWWSLLCGWTQHLGSLEWTKVTSFVLMVLVMALTLRHWSSQRMSQCRSFHWDILSELQWQALCWWFWWWL